MKMPVFCFIPYGTTQILLHLKLMPTIFSLVRCPFTEPAWVLLSPPLRRIPHVFWTCNSLLVVYLITKSTFAFQNCGPKTMGLSELPCPSFNKPKTYSDFDISEENILSKYVTLNTSNLVLLEYCTNQNCFCSGAVTSYENVGCWGSPWIKGTFAPPSWVNCTSPAQLLAYVHIDVWRQIRPEKGVRIRHAPLLVLPPSRL